MVYKVESYNDVYAFVSVLFPHLPSSLSFKFSLCVSIHVTAWSRSLSVFIEGPLDGYTISDFSSVDGH